MQQIERYGVIALLFMIVTFVTVSLWDGGEEETVDARTATARRPASVVHRQQPGSNRFDPIRTQVPVESRPLARKHVPLAEQRSMVPELEPSRLADVGHTSYETSVALQESRPRSERYTADPGRIRMERPRWNSDVPTASGRAEVAAEDRRLRETLELVKHAQPEPEAGTGPRETRAYVVKDGDTLERIARRELGDGRRWREIQALNAGIDPRRLKIGARLLIAGEARPQAGSRPVSSEPKRPAPAPSKVATTAYTVKRGDVLGRIAQRELGSAKLWPKIVELNPGVDPNRLHVGAVLRLPRVERPVAPERRLVAKADIPSGSRPRIR